MVAASTGVVVLAAPGVASACINYGSIPCPVVQGADGEFDHSGYLACLAATSAPCEAPNAPARATPSEVNPGSSVSLSAAGFQPGTPTNIAYCDAPRTDLGTATATSDGSVGVTVQVPAAAAGSSATLMVCGVSANGQLRQAAATVRLTGPTTPTPPQALPRTGSDTTRLLASGTSLVVLGGAALLGARRRKQPSVTSG